MAPRPNLLEEPGTGRDEAIDSLLLRSGCLVERGKKILERVVWNLGHRVLPNHGFPARLWPEQHGSCGRTDLCSRPSGARPLPEYPARHSLGGVTWV